MLLSVIGYTIALNGVCGEVLGCGPGGTAIYSQSSDRFIY